MNPGASGLTMFGSAFNKDMQQWWNTSTLEFEPWTSGNVANYGISPTVSSNGKVYSVAFPVNAPACNGVLYGYQQSGASPSPELNDIATYASDGYWNGLVFVVPTVTVGGGPLIVQGSGVPNGIATNAAMAPLSGVTVTAFLASLYNSGTYTPIQTAITDANGNWVMNLNYGTTYVFTFTLSGYTPAGIITYTTPSH